jgi:hypothetical protein
MLVGLQHLFNTFSVFANIQHHGNQLSEEVTMFLLLIPMTGHM